jgi:Domain of unknown function (DUF5615)
MIRFLADEDFNARIIRGVRRHFPEIDILRIQDAGLRTYHDRLILQNAAEMNRVLLSHDIRTMNVYAYERIAKSLPMPGVVLMDQDYPIRDAIDDIAIIAHCFEPDELIDSVRRLPL